MAYNLTHDQVLALEKRGAELSRSCKWDGAEILAIAYHALTDANFHTEAEKVGALLEALEHDE